MKIEQALVLYLLKNKRISLQGIGTFKIDGAFPEITDNDKPFNIPAESIAFTYDPKANEDADLIDFIVQNTKKIKPLASADLDSFLTLGRQFLNIGKPFNIQNLGTLEKLKSGALEFRPGPLIQRVEAPQLRIEDAGAEPYEQDMFHAYAKNNKSNKSPFIIIGIIILLGVGAWAAWQYGFRSKTNESAEAGDVIVPVPDSPAVISSEHIKDSLAVIKKMADSIKSDSLKLMQKSTGDTVSFNVVVFQSDNKDAAIRRLARLQGLGRQVTMNTNADSTTYKIVNTFALPLKDTAIVLDSLNNRYYRGKAHIELH